MNVKKSELVVLRKSLDEHFLKDHLGMPIENDTKVASWIQEHDQLAQELGEDPYQEPQKHWQ